MLFAARRLLKEFWIFRVINLAEMDLCSRLVDSIVNEKSLI